MPRGIAPPDFSTNVGRFRQNTNDTAYVDLVPPEPGFGDYEHCSDEEIESWLAQGGDNLNRGLGLYFRALAGQAALKASSISDHDLRVQTEKRAELLAGIADDWFELAAEDDINAGETDFLDVFGPPLMSGGNTRPEASPYRVWGL